MRRLLVVVVACCTPPAAPPNVVVMPPVADAAPMIVAANEVDAGVPEAALPPPSGPTFYDRFHPGVELAIEFDHGVPQPPAEALPALDLVAKSLSDWPRKVHVNGDSVATENKSIALARAKGIVAELVKRGVSATQLVAETRIREGQPMVKFFEDADLAPLELSQKHWEACCRRMTRVRFVLSSTRADSKDGREAYDEEKNKCAACNGIWGPRGLAGFPGCDCKFDDGGKPCSSPRECKGRCDVGWEGAIQQHGITCAKGAPCTLQGRCEEYNAHFGCHGWIEEDAKGVRGTKWICVD